MYRPGGEPGEAGKALGSGRHWGRHWGDSGDSGARLQRFPACKRVLSRHGPGPEASRRRRYAAFVRAGVDDPPACPWSKLLKQGVIGGEDFVDEVKKRLALQEASPEMLASRGWLDRPGLDDLIAVSAGVLDVDCSDWVPGRRSTTADRALVTYLAFKTYGYRGKELSDAMGYRSSTSIHLAAKRVEQSPALLRAWRRLRREVDAEFKAR